MTSGSAAAREPPGGPWTQLWKIAIVAYAFLAGLRTLSEFDLGWQMALGRWVAQHREAPSTDLFSYTAAGLPFIYPVGSALIFYLLGNYKLLSLLHAVVNASTAGILLLRRTMTSAALTVAAIPLLAIRTRPRADMFTVLLFAAFLHILWKKPARLWLLPILMIAWVNLHLGFVAGLALLAAYVATDWRKWPWLLATLAATLVNPYGWNVWRAVIEQGRMAALLRRIPEWGPAQIDLLSLRDPFQQLLLLAAAVLLLALWKRQFAAATSIAIVGALTLRHIRFEALLACTVVIVAPELKLHRAFAAAILLLAGVRSYELVTNRAYLARTDLGSFGLGLSWWFPERAAAFIERETLPAPIFNSYNEGGWFTWRLGEKYRDYIDGRLVPFGPELFERNRALMATLPDSPQWDGIQTILVPLGRYNGVNLFPHLRQFCASRTWRPVYLDEVSAVFVRRTIDDERLQIDCAKVALQGQDFDGWANAAAVLHALGRREESLEATSRALAIFPESAFVHFLRGNLFEERGALADAEREYAAAVALERNSVALKALAEVRAAQRR